MITTLVFDYGKVLAYPKTGNWFVTPNAKKILGFLNCLKIFFNYKKIEQSFEAAHRYLNDNQLLHTEQEEYNQFIEFYKIILGSLGIKRNIDDICDALARDCVYNDDKVIFYDDVTTAIEYFMQSYRIIILSDTWPSLKRILENKGIWGFFDDVIMSCDYGKTKESTDFFEIAVSELNLVPSECIFIDDSLSNLDNAKKVGFIPVLMDRKGKENNSKYPVIHNLNAINDIIATVT